MIDDMPGVHVGHRFTSEATPLLFEVNPSAQRLFDDPATRTFKAGGKLINLFGQRYRDMCGKHFGFCVCHK